MSERMPWAKEGVDRQSLSLSLRRCKESVHAVPGTKTQHCGLHVCCCEVLPCSWVHIRLSNRTRVRQSQTDCLVAVTKATRQMKGFSGSWFEGKVDHGGESMGPGKQARQPVTLCPPSGNEEGQWCSASFSFVFSPGHHPMDGATHI